MRPRPHSRQAPGAADELAPVHPARRNLSDHPMNTFVHEILLVVYSRFFPHRMTIDELEAGHKRSHDRSFSASLQATPAAANRSAPVCSVIQRECEAQSYRPGDPIQAPARTETVPDTGRVPSPMPCSRSASWRASGNTRSSACFSSPDTEIRRSTPSDGLRTVGGNSTAYGLAVVCRPLISRCLAQSRFMGVPVTTEQSASDLEELLARGSGRGRDQGCQLP